LIYSHGHDIIFTRDHHRAGGTRPRRHPANEALGQRAGVVSTVDELVVFAYEAALVRPGWLR
jgi:hypothetical protein